MSKRCQCPEGRIRGDPQRRIDPADRRARFGVGPAQPVSAPLRRRIPAHRRAQHRRAEPCDRQYPARGDADASVLGQLRGAAHPRHPAPQDPRCSDAGAAGGLSFEAANPRHAHEWEDLRGVKIPDDKVLIPGVIELDDQFRRASAAYRAAHRELRRSRRPRAGHRRGRLRLCHLCFCRQRGRALGGVGQTRGPRRRCAHRQRSAVGLNHTGGRDAGTSAPRDVDDRGGGHRRDGVPLTRVVGRDGQRMRIRPLPPPGRNS